MSTSRTIILCCVSFSWVATLSDSQLKSIMLCQGQYVRTQIGTSIAGVCVTSRRVWYCVGIIRELILPVCVFTNRKYRVHICTICQVFFLELIVVNLACYF